MNPLLGAPLGSDTLRFVARVGLSRRQPHGAYARRIFDVALTDVAALTLRRAITLLTVIRRISTAAHYLSAFHRLPHGTYFIYLTGP